jgi:hypothetical protein
MSEEELHFHGMHEDIQRTETQHARGLVQCVAFFTALMSTLTAVLSCQSAANQNEAMLA